MPIYDFEWFKKWEFNSRTDIKLNIGQLRKILVPSASEIDWQVIGAWFDSPLAFYEHDNFIISNTEGRRLAGGSPLEFNTIRWKIDSQLSNQQSKIFPNTDKYQQGIGLVPWLRMVAKNDFSPFETAHKYYRVLETLPMKFDDRNDLPIAEFDNYLLELRSKNTAYRNESEKRTKENLIIAGLLRRQPGPNGEEKIYIEYHPQQMPFNAWIEEFIERKFKIRKNDSKTDTPTKKLWRVDKLTSAIGKLSGMDEEIEEKAFPENRYFQEIDIDVERPFCFVLMPFTREYPQVNYKKVIKPHIEEKFGLRCYRADEEHSSKKIDDKIFTFILQSEFIIAEVANQNPNVMYELGLAHALDKDVVIIVHKKIHKDRVKNKLPFDINSNRVHFYRTSIELKDALEKGVSSIFQKNNNEI